MYFRWEKIAESMERYSEEVIKMAAKIKSNPYLVPISSAGQGVTGRLENRTKEHVSIIFQVWAPQLLSSFMHFQRL